MQFILHPFVSEAVQDFYVAQPAVLCVCVYVCAPSASVPSLISGCRTLHPSSIQHVMQHPFLSHVGCPLCYLRGFYFLKPLFLVLFAVDWFRVWLVDLFVCFFCGLTLCCTGRSLFALRGSCPESPVVGMFSCQILWIARGCVSLVS